MRAAIVVTLVFPVPGDEVQPEDAEAMLELVAARGFKRSRGEAQGTLVPWAREARAHIRYGFPRVNDNGGGTE